MPKLLLTNEVIAAELWKMLAANPAYSEDLTTKEKVAKSAACTYFKLRPGVQQTVAGDFPDIALAKSGWRTENALNGIFVAGNWIFRVRLENDTKYGFSVKVACRLSRSANSDGSSATLIGTYESPNVIALPAAAAGSVSDSWTASLAALTLSNEYLFAEYRIHIEVAGTSTTCQCSFACDENPTTADESIETTAISFTYKLYENLSALRDVFSSLYTKFFVALSYKLAQVLVAREAFSRRASHLRTLTQAPIARILMSRRVLAVRILPQRVIFREYVRRSLGIPRSMREDLSAISIRLASVRASIRRLAQDLSAIRDAFSSIYTPISVPVYKFVENLSALGVLPRRVTGYSRKKAQEILIQDALNRIVGLPRKSVEDLSALRDTFAKRASYLRRLSQFAYVQDTLSYFLVPLIPVYRFVQSIVVSIELRRRAGMARSVREDLSSIGHVFTHLLTVPTMVYRLVQDLSAISHVFSHIRVPFVGPIVDKFLEAKAKLESERDQILAKIAELEAELEKFKAHFKL